jgi:hypothetical protein
MGMSRLRSIPLAAQILLALLPVVVCVPLLCIVAILAQDQIGGGQSLTATAARQRTQAAAAEATQRAESRRHIAETATALYDAQLANEAATATAIAINRQRAALTLTAFIPATVTTTPTATVFFTPTPTTVTITLRECRGDEGTVFFGQAQPQSIHAYKTLSFTVPRGKYNLRIDWLRKKENNVNTEIEVNSSTTLAFGDQCQ